MTEFLKKAFGDAVTEQVLTDFKAELGKKFVAKADYNAKRDELKNARTELDSLSEATDRLREKAAEADRLNDEMSALKEKYDQHISVLNGKLEQVTLEGEINSLIRKKGGKNEKAVRALLSLSDENPVENAAVQLDRLIKTEPYLFNTAAPAGTRGNFPRGGSSSAAGLTYSQMMQLEANHG